MNDANQERDLALIEKIRRNDGEAREDLVCKYMPMVKYIVRKYYASFLEFDDLLQEGLIGLLSAINEYRPECYNVKFSSFAYICIVRKIYNAIKQSNGSKHRLLNDAVSLHGFVNQEETRTVFDLRPADEPGTDPVEVVEKRMMNQQLQNLLVNHLSVLEYAVISLLIQGYTCSEIEYVIGVNAKAVDNARTRVKSKLRRLVEQYGSLLSPQVPLSVRRRQDLCMNVRWTG